MVAYVGVESLDAARLDADVQCCLSDQWNRNPRPQLEPQITSLDKYDISSILVEAQIH